VQRDRPDNPDNLPQYPTISQITNSNGGINYWEVENGNVYSYDFIGFFPGVTQSIVSLHPKSFTLPCTYTVYQEMEIDCFDSLVFQYTENILTITVGVGNTYKVCRKNELTGAVACGSGTAKN
jgi:hypothetical protein